MENLIVATLAVPNGAPESNKRAQLTEYKIKKGRLVD